MEIKDLTAVLVVAMVGCILVAGFIPVMNNTVDPNTTFTNASDTYNWRMKEIKDGDNWTYSGGVWNYDGVSQTTFTSGINAMLGDNWCIRSNGQGRGETISGNATSLTATSDGVIITFTGLSGEPVQDLPAYGVYDKGDYMMKIYNKSVYVLDTSILFGTGTSAVDDVGMIVHVEGTIKDGVTFSAYSNRGTETITDAVFSNIQINATKVDGYKDLYLFSEITADVTFNATSGGVTSSHSGSVTYSYIVTPYEVTAEKAIHADANTATIISMIPFILIMGIVLMFVGVVIVRRYV